jgi:hypothetical protein
MHTRQLAKGELRVCKAFSENKNVINEISSIIRKAT